MGVALIPKITPLVKPRLPQMNALPLLNRVMRVS